MHDDFIRHGLSDLSMTQSSHISPLEPSFYGTSSVTDLPFRPSHQLPLPNTSRRGSMTDYEFPSNNYTFPPKPSTETFKRRDSLPHPALPITTTPLTQHPPVYDPYQRRHSIATADHPYQRHPAKYRGNLSFLIKFYRTNFSLIRYRISFSCHNSGITQLYYLFCSS